MRLSKKAISLMATLLIFLCAPQFIFAEYIHGNLEGSGTIPADARAEDVSKPDHIIGTGTPESCTSQDFVAAVAKGGTIVFNGGTQPFTLTLDQTAKIFNNGNPDVIIDGGGLVTLSGGGKRRILYMNTADQKQVWTTDHAQNQDHPRLTVQNLTFADGNSIGDTEYSGGGAIWVRGGRFKVINCLFVNNKCLGTGPDVGGGAIRVFDQYNDLPVFVVNTTFGGAPGLGNVGSNGGAISSIGVSWTLINCFFSYNEAIGFGGNPAEKGTVGGGSGGAIYNDGNEMTLTLDGTVVENNKVNAYGSGIFFVTNNHTGNIVLKNAVIRQNTGGSWYPLIPGISMHGDTKVSVTNTLPTSKPTIVKLVIDGQTVLFQAYNIHGNNYLKLRDIALALNPSQKNFQVGWDVDKQEIILTSGMKYNPMGNELSLAGDMGPVAYTVGTPHITLDRQAVQLKSYVIRQAHYFKLRDIAAALDFGLIWDPATSEIRIDTGVGYAVGQ